VLNATEGGERPERAVHLGGHLVDSVTDFVCFTHGDLADPGTFVWPPPLPVDPH
jgi:hypothetical protein